MRTLSFLFLLAPLATVGCGVGASQSGTPPLRDGGEFPDATPITDDAGGCTSRNQLPADYCSDCSGDPVEPVCTNGAWQCPSYGCPAKPCETPAPTCYDCSGNIIGATCTGYEWQCPSLECQDAGGCGNPIIACPEAFPGTCAPFWTPECIGNQWNCVEEFPPCADAGWDASDDGSIDDASVDAPTPPPPPPPFACGTVGCDPATTYCQITTGGPVLEDGGGNGYFYCPSLPTSCAPGAEATCACVQAEQGIGCGCVESGGEVTITCEVP